MVFESDDFMANILIIDKHLNNLKQLNDSSILNDWNIPYGPAVVNGFFNIESNQICIIL